VVRQVLKLEDTGSSSGSVRIGAVVCSTGYVLFSSIVEPAGTRSRPTADSAVALLREGVALVRTDVSFRRLLLSRATLSVWFTMLPFMVLFAVRDLGGGARIAGTF
jgi:hypothetical protein